MSTSVVLTRLDGESVARWLTAGRDALDAAKDEIDELNVYPVPDGDTGTNLHLTLVAAVEAADRAVPAGRRHRDPDAAAADVDAGPRRADGRPRQLRA